MRTKTLLLTAAVLVAGMIPVMAQSNPGSTNGTDVEMQLAWPDGQTYSTSLSFLWNYIALKSAVNGKINLHGDYTWNETGGGSGSEIDQVDHPYYWTLQDDDFTWPGGRWPELGVGVDTYIPNGSTNVSYPPSAGYDRFYFGSQSFQSSDGNLTIQNQDQPEFVMLTGGAPGDTGNELYEISGFAGTLFYTDKSLPSMDAIVVPPNQIQIGNLGAMTTTGTNNGVPYGTVWASLPVHTEVPVTPHVSASGYHFGNFQVSAYKLVSQCVATTPANQARTNIGVGEQVNLNFSPTLSVPYSNVVWTTTAGSLTSTQGNSTQLIAPSRATTVTVTAKVFGKPMTKTFKVIEPSGVVMVTNGLKHTVNRPDIGMHTLIYLKPDSVNFGAVWCQEEQAYAIANGVYAPFNGTNHESGPIPFPFSSTVVSGLGTLYSSTAGDNIYSGDPETAPPFAPGTEIYNIPWDFRVGSNGAWKTNFITVTGTCSLGTGGVLTASKARASWSCNVNDASISY